MVEPIVEKRFEYKGFPCVVLFMPMGHRCGYVGLPESNIYHGKFYGDIDIQCHGGLTLSVGSLYGQNDKSIWWIGFDCNHSTDAKDLVETESLFSYDEETMRLVSCYKEIYKAGGAEREVRTMDFVENECRNIVDQLLDVNEKR